MTAPSPPRACAATATSAAAFVALAPLRAARPRTLLARRAGSCALPLRVRRRRRAVPAASGASPDGAHAAPQPHAVRASSLSTTAASSVSVSVSAASASAAAASAAAAAAAASTKPSPIARFLRAQWRSDKPTLLAALLLAMLGSLASISQPILFGRVIATLSLAHTLSPRAALVATLRRTMLLFAAWFIDLIVTLFYVALAVRLGDLATRALRERLFSVTLANDIAFFDKTGRARVERALVQDLRIVRQVVWDNIARDCGLRSVFDFIFGLCATFVIAPRVSVPVFGVLVPIIATVVSRMGLYTGRLATRIDDRDVGLQRFIAERLRGLRAIKAFGAEALEQRALDARLSDATAASSEYARHKADTEGANRMAINVTILGIAIIGGYFVCMRTMRFESLSSLVGFTWVLNYAVSGIVWSLTDITRASSALRNVYGIIDAADEELKQREAYDCPVDQDTRPLAGHVRFDNVHFHYPSRPTHPVLNGISFSMTPGQLVALVGESGGGKSTVAAMLCRFYKASSGCVLIDGEDIQCIPKEAFSRHLSVVDQDPFLFQGTIRENIAYGLPDEVVSHEQIARAAKEANAHEFIEKLSEGYDTFWHPGSNLSGGQRQRIAIARSLIKSPRILVLDEATSALDQESERMVQMALERMMKNRTVLIIAHRLSTVRTADQILYVKGGVIVERGSYDELYAMEGGLFRGLVQSSSSLVRDDGNGNGSGNAGSNGNAHGNVHANAHASGNDDANGQ